MRTAYNISFLLFLFQRTRASSSSSSSPAGSSSPLRMPPFDSRGKRIALLMLHLVCYRGQTRANLAAAVLAAPSVFAKRRASHLFQMRGALLAREAPFEGAGTKVIPAAADLVLDDDDAGLCNKSCNGRRHPRTSRPPWPPCRRPSCCKKPCCICLIRLMPGFYPLF